jgi:hypothetical protein
VTSISAILACIALSISSIEGDAMGAAPGGGVGEEEEEEEEGDSVVEEE